MGASKPDFGFCLERPESPLCADGIGFALGYGTAALYDIRVVASVWSFSES